MKRLSVILTCALALTACTFSQCRKKDDGPSETRKNLQGSWRVTAYGLDLNENAALDLDEFVPVTENPVIVNVYSADGTGSTTISYNGFPIVATTSWELSNADRTLKVVSTTSGVSLTQYYSIVSLSPNAMILADTTRAQRSFTVATKQ